MRFASSQSVCSIDLVVRWPSEATEVRLDVEFESLANCVLLNGKLIFKFRLKFLIARWKQKFYWISPACFEKITLVVVPFI